MCRITKFAILLTLVALPAFAQTQPEQHPPLVRALDTVLQECVAVRVNALAQVAALQDQVAALQKQLADKDKPASDQPAEKK